MLYTLQIVSKILRRLIENSQKAHNNKMIANGDVSVSSRIDNLKRMNEVEEVLCLGGGDRSSKKWCVMAGTLKGFIGYTLMNKMDVNYENYRLFLQRRPEMGDFGELEYFNLDIPYIDDKD